MLTGSVSRGVADDVSDIEMLVVTPDQLSLDACFALALQELAPIGYVRADADHSGDRPVRIANGLPVSLDVVDFSCRIDQPVIDGVGDAGGSTCLQRRDDARAIVGMHVLLIRGE